MRRLFKCQPTAVYGGVLEFYSEYEIYRKTSVETGRRILYIIYDFSVVKIYERWRVDHHIGAYVLIRGDRYFCSCIFVHG